MTTLVRAYLRRGRWALLAWVLALGLLPALMVISTSIGYPTQADREAFATQAMTNLAEVALRGPVFAPTTGGLVAWTLASSGSLVGCVAALIFIVSYTRSDEQAGRLELELSGRVTRGGQLGAALLVVGGAGVLTGAVAFIGMVATGMDASGSALLGLVLTSSMLFFTALGAVCAQLATNPGSAGGLGALAMILFLLVTAIGDTTDSPLVWFSPFGWARHAQAFVANRFWVPLIPLALTAVLSWLALRLNRSRDYASGPIAPRPGRPDAPSWIRSPVTLAIRLQRGTTLSWTLTLGLLGTLLGSVLGNLDQQLAGTAFEDFARRHGGTVGEVFFQFVLYLLAQIATIAALAAVLTLRQDEANGSAESILSRPVTRRHWAAANWLVAAGSAAMILIGVGFGAALSSGRWSLPLSTVAYLPAALAVAGLALALVGWAPRVAVAVSWTVLGLLMLVDLFAEFNLLPADLVRNLSPFAAIFAGLSTGGLPVTLTVLTVLGIGLAGLGVTGLGRRDLQPS